ncbi:hypothetical protein BsWGS_19227 [Bradybaena similaris]
MCCLASSACSLCPAGTFLEHMCQPNSGTQCVTCQEGTFSASASHLEQCRPCSECSAGMYVDQPCRSTADTACSPCSRSPGVKSDYFVASCEGGTAEGTGTNLDDLMMSDGTENAQNPDTFANEDVHSEHVGHEGNNKVGGAKETLTNSGSTDIDDSNNKAGKAMEDNKEIPENAPSLAGTSIKNLELHNSVADETMNDNGHILSDTNKVNTNEGQNSTNQEKEHSDNAILVPLPVKTHESEVAIELTTLSTHEHSQMDEVKLEAVKLNNNEEENNMKGEMNGLYSQTSASYKDQLTESRLSDHVVSSQSRDTMNNTDLDLLEGVQADAPVDNGVTLEGMEPFNIDALSDNITDQHAGNSSNHGEKPMSAKVQNEDVHGRKRAAIILGVAIASMAFFTLLFFASKCFKRRRGRTFKEMKKVNDFDQESAELHPLSYSDTGSHEDPDAQVTNGLYRQGPPVAPAAPRKNQPSEKQLQPADIQVAPETCMTIPTLTVSPAPDDPEGSLSDHGMPA